MKGCQKKIIMLKNTDSDIFDEAYFILKDNRETTEKVSETEMIKEANRIVNDNLISGYFHKTAAKRTDKLLLVRTFIGGFGGGALLCLLVMLLLH